MYFVVTRTEILSSQTFCFRKVVTGSDVNARHRWTRHRLHIYLALFGTCF